MMNLNLKLLAGQGGLLPFLVGSLLLAQKSPPTMFLRVFDPTQMIDFVSI
jgi:hypothetical protein